MALRARSRAPQDENAAVLPHLSGMSFFRICGMLMPFSLLVLDFNL